MKLQIPTQKKINKQNFSESRMRSLCALLVGACTAAAIPAGMQIDPPQLPSMRALAPAGSARLLPRAHPVAGWPLELETTAALRLKGGGDQHRHAVLAEQLGFGSHAYVLPLLYSMLAGLSTGIGGLLCLPIRGTTLSKVLLIHILDVQAAL
jgi:hypothetical protein